MELIKLGDNLYKLVVPFFGRNSTALTRAILKLQGEGKVITAYSLHSSGLRNYYLICTADRQGK